MVEVRLKPLGKAKGGADEELAAATAWAKEHSGALLARAIRDAGRYRSDLSLLKTALGAAGQDARGADLVAALAAGRRLLMFDEPLDEETAAAEAEAWAPLIAGREQTATTTNEGQQCLNRLFAMNSGKHQNDRHLSLGEIIQQRLDPGDGYSKEAHDVVLKAFGLRVENGPTGSPRPGPWLLVSNNHDALRRGFAGTNFGNWRGTLEYLGDLGPEYAPQTMPKPVRFGMHQSRALAIPLTPWLEGPVGIGEARGEPTPFDPPSWHREAPVSGGASHDSSRSASHDGGVDG